MESTLKNMVLTLLLITLAAAAALGVVYNLTKEPIAAAKAGKTVDAIAGVLGQFDNDPSKDTVTLQIDGLPVKVYTAKKGGQASGYAVETITKQGFGGEIRMMVGFDPKGEILNIEVLEQNETPGLGSKMADPGNVLLVSFQGKNPADLNMKVAKDGGDIDAITASTISSRAYIDAVERAWKAFREVALGASAAQADPFATLFGEYTNDPAAEAKTVEVDGRQALVYPVSHIDGLAGYAVETSTDQGFQGLVRLLTGFDVEGKITGVVALEQNETEGFGRAISEPDNALETSVKGKTAGEIVWEFKDKGGSVDAISGSTITSRAWLEAVKQACAAYNTLK